MSKLFNALLFDYIMSLPVSNLTNKLKHLIIIRKGFCSKKSKNYNINRFFYLKGNVSLGSDISVNRNVIIASSLNIPISIGDYCLIGPNVVIRNANHGFEDVDTPIRLQPKTATPINIGDNVWIGANCVVLGGADIGEGCIVAAGAVVTKGHYPPYSILGGVPAKIIKSRIEGQHT